MTKRYAKVWATHSGFTVVYGRGSSEHTVIAIATFPDSLNGGAREAMLEATRFARSYERAQLG